MNNKFGGTEKMEKLDGMSMNVEQAEMEKLKAVFPQCFAEGKLDIDKLLSLCGEYIDNDFEKYKFEWKGKLESLRLAQKRSTGTLRPCREESVNFDDTQNLYIEGDNLEVLKLLQTAYYNKIKMIYIDPPYNTGSDFVYADDFADPMTRYKEVTGQTTRSNAETMGRFHTNWLNMMYPRLRLAYNLLTDDGIIFISIDDNEIVNMRKICDEIFGEENFVGSVIWERAFAPKNDAKYFSASHDYVVVYAKKIVDFVIGKLPRTEEANARYSNPDNDPRGPWTADNLTVKTYSANNDYPITTPGGRIVNPSHGSCWRVSKERFQELVDDNRVYFGDEGNNVPRLKRFLNELQSGMTPTTLWKFQDVGHNQEGRQELKKVFDGKGYFDGPKPTRLINRILQIANVKDNDLVLDFFSGSATTAHAVMKYNLENEKRIRFICVQLPELCDEKSEAYKDGYKNICEIGKERIRRAGKKILEENAQAQIGNEEKKPLDIGFKVFKLDTSNLKTWDGTPIEEHQIDLFYERLNSMINAVKDDRTDMDVVYEVMLKMGIPLDIPVTYIDVNDKVVYVVGEFLLMICLADKITAEDIEGMAAYAPAKIICAEAGFADDSALSNAHYILRDRAIELKLV